MPLKKGIGRCPYRGERYCRKLVKQAKWRVVRELLPDNAHKRKALACSKTHNNSEMGVIPVQEGYHG